MFIVLCRNAAFILLCKRVIKNFHVFPGSVHIFLNSENSENLLKFYTLHKGNVLMCSLQTSLQVVGKYEF